MTTVLVTGGAGFIGSHLVRALLAEGKRVRVLDNFCTGKRENIAGLPVELIEGDVRAQPHLAEALRGVEVVFHQAAFISVPQSIEEPQTCFDVNVQGTLRLLDEARQAGVQRVVLASSCAVYGDSANLPLREEEACAPLSPYAASKQVTEIYAGVYSRLYHMQVTALRYFNVYGPRQSPDSAYAAVIPIFIKRWLSGQAPTVYGDGSQKRDFVYVEDVVRANLAAANCAQAGGGVFNVCTGTETSLLELLDTLRCLLSNPPQELRAALRVTMGETQSLPEARFAAPRSGDILRSLGDPSRARRVLNYNTSVSLRQGLVNTILAFL